MEKKIKNQCIHKIGVLGAFGFSSLAEATGGQPVKSRMLYLALCNRYGETNVLYVETYKWRCNPLRMLFQLIRVIRKCSIIIMLPAQNGVKFFLPILIRLKRKKTKLYYDVIGGWIAEMAHRRTKLIDELKQLDGIWVETTSMKKALSEIGVNNVNVVPNFKQLHVIDENRLTRKPSEPYHVCTFSRVMREKGITNAIVSVGVVNKEIGRRVFILDVYGPVDDSYKSEFSRFMSKAVDYAQYKGIVDPEASVQTLQNYDALLFPTEFYTEGVPGTIIDAYSAGVPVITSLWLNSADVFWEGETGWGYPFGDKGGLERQLRRFFENPIMFSKMRKKCTERASLFSCDYAMNRISSIIEKG